MSYSRVGRDKARHATCVGAHPTAEEGFASTDAFSERAVGTGDRPNAIEVIMVDERFEIVRRPVCHWRRRASSAPVAHGTGGVAATGQASSRSRRCTYTSVESGPVRVCPTEVAPGHVAVAFCLGLRDNSLADATVVKEIPMRFGHLARARTAAVLARVFSVNGQDPANVYDFALTRPFLKNLRDGHTILPTYKMHIDARSKMKGIGEDCEMHLAATLATPGTVDPDAVVVEPPNLCRNPVSTGGTWEAFVDANVKGKDCDVSGFPRLFTEHATGGGEHASNPNHVFEIHPALKMNCAGSAPLDFTPFMGAPEGLRHIKPESAEKCLAGRTLSVRWKDGQYEFLQKGGSGCGNFAIFEISHIHKQWIRATGGGHSALARIHSGR